MIVVPVGLPLRPAIWLSDLWDHWAGWLNPHYHLSKSHQVELSERLREWQAFVNDLLP